MRIPCETPVVLLGATHHGTLGIARSLGRLGIPIYIVADTAGIKPVLFSRYCSKSFPWNLRAHEPEDSVRFLLEVPQKIGGRPLLIPTNDHAAILVADHAATLSRAYLFANQSAQRSRALASKKWLFHLATQHGIPTPHLFVPQCKSDLRAFASTATFPVMLKTDEGARKLEGRRGKFVVHTAAELLDKYERLEDWDQPNLLIQEYIPGGDDSIWMFNGYFNKNSECLFGMTGKKIRQNPIHTGASCLAICLHNETVHQLTTRFMKAIGYQGILDIGYRYDRRDGQYKVLDANPRIGSTFRLFAGDNGMDVARAQYLDLTNQEVPLSSNRDGRKWIVEDLDLISSFRYYRGGELTIRGWIKSFSGIEETAYLSLSDPLPALAAVIEDFRSLAARARRRSALKFTPSTEPDPA
ncbi:MAG: hypothetical protein JO033_23655 [Acidobacteriaceae bacterium]|nr:hypothetical protein [Acidobacteriaceae bacterium]